MKQFIQRSSTDAKPLVEMAWGKGYSHGARVVYIEHLLLARDLIQCRELWSADDLSN